MRRKLITSVLVCALASVMAACSTTKEPAPAPTTAAPPSPSLKAVKLVAPATVAGLPAYRPVNAKILCAWFDAQSAGLIVFPATTADAKAEAIKVYAQAVQR